MKRRLFIILVLIVSVALSSIFLFLRANAQFEGEGLTISPPIKELTLIPGQKFEQTIKLTNPTKNLVEVYPKVMNFKAGGEGGEPAFYSAEEGGEKYTLSKWISINQAKIALTPQQVVEFKYTIDVPSDAEPGGHYGVVFFANEPPENEDSSVSKVTLGSMIGSLVLTKVPGDINDEARLESFNVDRLFNLKNKVNIVSRIRNLGNVHFKPDGEITIKSLFGSTIDTLEFNPQSGNVLPNSIRRFENEWKSEKMLIGPYTADAKYIYGETEKVLSGKVTFWIIPWWGIVIFVVVLFVIVFLLWRWRRRRRKARKAEKERKEKEEKKIILR